MRTRVLWVWLAAAPWWAAWGGDWPTWRHDARRTAAAPESLPAALRVRWVRQLPVPLLAWPHEPRLHFDACYEPVVSGTLLFLGSPNDGSLAAFDAATGEERWRVYTEGPVRFAPVAWRGRLYAGSDDGFLYCLDAKTGRLLWQVRGAPDGRPERRHLGNARLISYWPVRGGPVLAHGTVYFGAGIWPTLGVFVVAVDAGTGRIVWRNGDLGFIEGVRVDHNALFDTGLSPQGYLAVADDLLIVPNGRSMPAVLDRRTGKLLRYVQGYRNGDCRVALAGRLAFVGTSGVVDLRTGREVGSRWLAAGKDAPDRFVASKFDLFEGPIFPYKLFAGCDARSVFADGRAYGSHQGTFHAYGLAGASVSEYDKEHAGHKLRPWRWDAPALWTLPTEHAKRRPASTALVKAGGRLYGHAGSTIVAVELPEADAKPRVAWQQAVEGTPSSMLAADGKLFVATREGSLYCFGGEEGEPRRYPLGTTPLLRADDRWSQAAAETIKRTKTTEGYALVLGVGSGRLMAELLARTGLHVVGIGRDREAVNALRATLTAAGLYGTRAEVFVGDPRTFPLPPYLASLVVSEELDAAAFAGEGGIERLFAVLRPYGGSACLQASGGAPGIFERRAASAGLESADVSRGGGYVVLRRVRALPGSAAWTHETSDAARTHFSTDDRVRAPLGILWYGDGPGYGFWKRKDYGIGVKPQVIGGRLFAFRVGGSTLVSYDVFTGRQLWQRQVAPFTRYASMADGIYVAGGDLCQVLDPATGEPRKTFQLDLGDTGGRKPGVSDIRVGTDVILVALAFDKVRVIEKGLWDSTLLVALDRGTGRQLWRREAEHRFSSQAIALGDGMAFCTDSPTQTLAARAERRGEEPQTTPSTLLALDARTGQVRWTATTTNPHRTYDIGSWLGIRANDDWVAYAAEPRLAIAGKHGVARAYGARSGTLAWETRVGGQPLVVMGDTFMAQSGEIFDVRTGKPVGKAPAARRGGCNYFVAGRHLAFLRDYSAAYVELDAKRKHHLRSVRSGCSNSLIAADGVLSVPNFAVGCVCNYPIQTSFALVHMPEVAGWAGDTPLKLPGRDKPAAPRRP